MMATRTAKDAETGEEITIDDNGQVIEEHEEQTPAEQDYEITLNNWLADLGGDMNAAISVYRYDPKTNKPSFVDSIGAQDMEGVQLFKTLKEEYGGGKFRIQLRADGRIVKTQTLHIEPPPKQTQQSSGPLGNDLPALIRELKADNNSGNDMSIVLQAMQQQNQQFQLMMVEMVKAMGASNSNQPPPPSMADVIASVAAIKDMSTPAQQPDATELILKGVELATALRGDSEGGENMYTLLNSAVKGLGGAISDAAKVMPHQLAPQLATQPTPPQPGNNPMQITADDTARPREPVSGGDPQVETESRNEIPEQLKPFEPYVNQLVQFAAMDKDPELYAEIIIDQMGDEYALAWVGERQGREMLLGIFTQAQPFAAWFENVGTIIYEMLQDDDAGAGVDDTAEPAQNADKPPQDGAESLQVSNVSDDRPHSEAETEASDASIDGDSERPGGDSTNVTIDGETSQPIQDEPAN